MKLSNTKRECSTLQELHEIVQGLSANLGDGKEENGWGSDLQPGRPRTLPGTSSCRQQQAEKGSIVER